jgi:tetratricopeptide (TPR) repeat protein
MRRDSIVSAVAGVFFGLLVGWIIGSQQNAVRPGGSPAPTQAAAPAGPAASSTPPAAPLDENRARALQARAESNAQDAPARAELANLYFDAERYQEAIRWYEDALRIDPKNVDASTDLGVAYYYLNQPDRALQQLDHSLSIDAKHTKTLLNQGIIRAFGKQDLEGAVKSWQQVVALSPDSPEGRAAKQALDNVKSAHPGVGAGATARPPGS